MPLNEGGVYGERQVRIQQIWIAPATATTTGGADQFDFGTAVPANLQNLVQPDYPRNLIYNITGTISALSITATGVDAQGNAVSETPTFTADTDMTGNVAFATVTQIRINSQSGGAGGEKLDIGYGVKMGLCNPISASADIYKSLMDGVNVAMAGHTIDVGNATISFATPPDNTHNYEIFYKGL